MKEIVLDIVLVAFPIVVAIIGITIIALTIFSKKYNDNIIDLNIPLGIATFPIKLKNKICIVIFCIIIACVNISYAFCRDYSFLFPKHLNYKVYYDLKGVEESIILINSFRETPLYLDNSWKIKRKEWFSQLRNILGGTKNSVESFLKNAQPDQYLASSGNAVHGVRFYKHWQKYCITKISGQIIHKYHPPNKPSIDLESRYCISDTPHRFVGPNLEFFIKGKVVVEPRMKQSLMFQERDLYSSEIVGVTLIDLWPYVTLELTLFCLIENDLLTPIGYAYYERE